MVLNIRPKVIIRPTKSLTCKALCYFKLPLFGNIGTGGVYDRRVEGRAAAEFVLGKKRESGKGLAAFADCMNVSLEAACEFRYDAIPPWIAVGEDRAFAAKRYGFFPIALKIGI